MLSCRAGCRFEDVTKALGLDVARDLFGKPGGTAMGVRNNFQQRDYDLWSKIYAHYVGSLTLSDEHRTWLKGKGLSEADILRGSYRTADTSREFLSTEGVDFFKVPGFERDLWGGIQPTVRRGLIIPVLTPTGWIRAVQVRSDDEDRQHGAASYIWLSGGPGGTCGAPCHVPFGTVPRVMAKVPLRITEGPLKANISHSLSEFPTIGLPGSGLWKSCLPIVKALRPAGVRVALDMDWVTNGAVRAARRDLSQELRKMGLKVTMEEWDGAYKGIDDALLANVPIEAKEGDADGK